MAGGEVRVKRAGSRKAVNAANLAALGAERLADLLMEAADADPALKRRVRMELAGEAGADHLALEIGKRLTAIEGRRSKIHWRKYKAFVRDLEVQRAMIAGPLAELDPRMALETLWRFLRLAEGIFRRTDDGRGEIAGVFEAAVADAGALTARAKADPAHVAEQVVGLIEDNDEVLEGLAGAVIPALEPAGVEALRVRLTAAWTGRSRPPPALRRAIQHVADAQGDVEGFIATIPAAEARLAPAGAEIARRLLAAGRVEDALAALAKSAPLTTGRTLLPGVQDWEEVYLAALEADGQGELAQEMRWAAFEKRLAADRLRAFLKRLADFDDVEAEDRAMAYAQGFAGFSEALRFFVEWPAASQAATLVLARGEEIEAGKVALLEAAAAMLAGRHPLAATLVLRAMIADTLRWARAALYGDAERQLGEVIALAEQIEDWRGFEDHLAFIRRMAQLRRV